MANEVALAAALLTAVVSFGLMWRLTRSARAQPAAAAAAPSASMAGAGHDELLLRFVTDAAGTRQGETVAADGDHIILKTPQGFASVPAGRLRPDGAGLRLEGDVDWEAARRAGEAWRSRSHKEITYTSDELSQDAS
jgi:hypothetical protein